MVSNAPDATEWLPGSRVISDRRPERGSVVGLHSALTLGGDVLVVAWDMPFVTAELLSLVSSRLAAGVSAAVPYLADGPEAFCAAYASGAREYIERAIDDGAYRMSDVLSRLPFVARIGSKEISALGDPARLFFNVNTPADLARAEEMARGG